MRQRPVVAIDGPSGAGKSTVARGVARKLGYAFIDTGALYRTVARLADENDVDWSDGEALAALAGEHEFAFDEEGNLSLDGHPVGDTIRTPRMSMGASAVAKHPRVRAALLEVQRAMGAEGGVVLEGRDIGTVVFPDAEVKIFLNASARERARRRMLELQTRGEVVTLEEVERDQEARDRSDRERKVSPLRRADDAIDVDCDKLDAKQVIEVIISAIKASFPLTS